MTFRSLSSRSRQAKSEKPHSWYQAQRYGLGGEFSRAAQACVEAIARNPNAYPTVVGPIRKALVRKFPYAIYYTSVEQTIFIIACYHGRRDPTSLQDRL